ncbi:hypothetical protein [Pontivivens insulae]|uniref:Dihydrodipicolinate reductase n=1 Tax=Pontivivens insulae TaxID=1639689 RepID=A0A2R8AAT6_9RHOB|nr:hypothetical protein [Pontivivens insulae]RED13237.1 hypothetical protein DFR53_2373 [Pontivivens insulae]SPF29329.1 hypothetical protein POI8812_01637 [Pontivivens insulae]
MRAWAIACCVALPVAAQEPGQIVDEEVFRANALDRVWLAPGGQVQIFSDGTLRANWGGRILSAEWEWRQDKGMMCREGDFDGDPRPYECQIISFTEDGISISRFEGRGPTFFFVEE